MLATFLLVLYKIFEKTRFASKNVISVQKRVPTNFLYNSYVPIRYIEETKKKTIQTDCILYISFIFL